MTSFYKKNKEKIILVFSFLFFIYFLIWSLIKPYNFGPDEYHRYPAYFYVFIHNSLPSGWAEEIRNPIWGFSYAFMFTWLPTLVSVFFMKMTSIFSTDVNILFHSARIPSCIMGALCVYLIFKILDFALKNEKAKWVTWAFIVSIPQFAFLSSYINNDIFALCGALAVVYSWFYIINKKLDVKICLIFSFGMSVIILSYYNAYGWIVCSLLFVLTIMISKKEIKNKNTWLMLLLISAIVIFTTAFFCIRNIFMYDGDLFGIKTLLKSNELYAWDSIKPSVRQNPRNTGMSILDVLFDGIYVKVLFLSFIGVFGYMQFGLRRFVYIFYFIAFSGSIILFIVSIFASVINSKKSNNTSENNVREKFILLAFLFISALIVFLLTLYNSWNNDYSPQGRYLYPLLPSLVAFFGLGIDYLFVNIEKIKIKNTNTLKTVLNILTASAVFVFTAVSIYCFLTVYIPANVPVSESDPTPEESLITIKDMIIANN